MPCPKKVQKKYKKGKIETYKRRKHFFHTFLYLPGEWTNQRYVPKHSVVSKTPDSKIGVVGSTSLPEKRSVHRKPEYLSLFTGSKFATQNPSNFGATTSHWLLYILLFSFFLILTDGCVEPYAWRRVYTFCIRQPTSQYPVGSFLVIPKSPQSLMILGWVKNFAGPLSWSYGIHRLHLCRGVPHQKTLCPRYDIK